jgi:hypothetical protein
MKLLQNKDYLCLVFIDLNAMTLWARLIERISRIPSHMNFSYRSHLIQMIGPSNFFMNCFPII